MRRWVGVTVHGSQSPPTPPVLHPWLPLWNYIGSCHLLWGANAPWYQRVSCRCQLTLPPTLLSLRAIAFAGPLPLMDPNMAPRWHEMAMRGEQDIWRANALPGWGDCSWQSIAAHSTCSLPMFGLGEMVITARSCLTTTDIGLPRIFQAPESLHGFMLLRKWVSLPSLSTRPAP